MDENNSKNSNERESLIPRLSVLAAYDEVSRSLNSLIDCDDYSVMNQLMVKCEENRLNWVSTQRKVDEMKAKAKETEDSNKRMTEDIQKATTQYSEELHRQNDIKKEIRELTSKLKNIKSFVTNELSVNNNDTTSETIDDRLISLVTDLDTILEVTEDSMDGNLEFDKSEEFN